MPSWRTILRMSLITVGVMFVANQAAAMNPMLRRVFKGAVVTPVESAAPGYQDNWMRI